MTRVYFIRHAESDRTVRDGRVRPLTERGYLSRALVTEYLMDKNIDVLLSSPFKRAIDTISGFSEESGLNIEIDEDFKEQRSSSDMRSDNPDFRSFLERQWADFSYAYSDGECLNEVQTRNIAALKRALTVHRGKNIAIGTHATALSTIINYYDSDYGYAGFLAMEHKLPWAAVMLFDGLDCLEIKTVDL